MAFVAAVRGSYFPCLTSHSGQRKITIIVFIILTLIGVGNDSTNRQAGLLAYGIVNETLYMTIIGGILLGGSPIALFLFLCMYMCYVFQ